MSPVGARPADPSLADLARLVAVPAIWGGTFVGGKIVVATLTPLMGSFARYVVACVALLIAALVLEGGLPRLTGRQWLGTLVLGVFGVVAYNLLFMGALEKLPASRAALIIALNPAVTIAISAVALKERLRPRRWLGVVLALLGVAIVISRGEPSSFVDGGVGFGELLMLGAVVAWALYTILGRKVMGGLTPLAATSYAALWGTLLLGALAAPGFAGLSLEQFHWRVNLSLLYLGVLGTAVAFVWYYTSVKKLGASVTSIFNNLVPVFGVAISVALLGEPLLVSMLVGGAVTIGGVMMVSRA
jgi:drug/metabolite transporter (DMT)-like permease